MMRSRSALLLSAASLLVVACSFGVNLDNLFDGNGASGDGGGDAALDGPVVGEGGPTGTDARFQRSKSSSSKPELISRVRGASTAPSCVGASTTRMGSSAPARRCLRARRFSSRSERRGQPFRRPDSCVYCAHERLGFVLGLQPGSGARRRHEEQHVHAGQRAAALGCHRRQRRFVVLVRDSQRWNGVVLGRRHKRSARRRNDVHALAAGTRHRHRERDANRGSRCHRVRSREERRRLLLGRERQRPSRRRDARAGPDARKSGWIVRCHGNRGGLERESFLRGRRQRRGAVLGPRQLRSARKRRHEQLVDSGQRHLDRRRDRSHRRRWIHVCHAQERRRELLGPESVASARSRRQLAAGRRIDAGAREWDFRVRRCRARETHSSAPSRTRGTTFRVGAPTIPVRSVAEHACAPQFLFPSC